MKIALLCPTRNRTEGVKRLIASLEKTASPDNIVLYLGIDSDDRSYSNVRLRPWVKVLDMGSGKDFAGIGQIWNKMAKQIPEEIFGMCNDDYVYDTPQWDKAVLNRFEFMPPDKMLFVYLNDRYVAPGLGVVNFIHREYYDRLGYYVREDFKHGFQDTWLHDVYRRMGRTLYLENIIARHLHYTAPGGIGKPDATSQRLLDTWNKELWQKAMDDFHAWGDKRQKEADFLLGKTQCRE